MARTKKQAPPPPTRKHARGSRYTPPAPQKEKSSHLWVPVTMFTCLALGIVVIAGNYLELLPGVGPAIARRIVESRAAEGPFPTVDALDRVKGIGPRTVERLRPFVSVGVEDHRDP